MKSKRLNNFLYCFDLETGGLILGWFGIVGSIFAVLICTLMIVGLSDSYLTDENLQQMGFGDTESIDPERMDMIRTVLTIVSSFGIIISISNFIVCIYLIRGTKNKCPRQLKIAMIYFAFSAILSLFGMVHLSVSALFNVIYSFYAFIIVYSLWRKFQEKDDPEEPSAPPAVIEHNVA